MQLSVTRQNYNSRDAAELAEMKRPYYFTFIRNQLKLKQMNDSFIRECVEDVYQEGIIKLLESRYDCANADEAIVEAMTRAVQEAVRDLTQRKEIPETLTYSDGKDGDRELSRFDLNGGTPSAEETLIELEDICTLDEAVERLEAIRYTYGCDITLNVLLHAGVLKEMWCTSAVNGLLMAFGSAIPDRKFFGDSSVAQVLSAVVESNPSEIVETMRRNLSRCAEMLMILGYQIA